MSTVSTVLATFVDPVAGMRVEAVTGTGFAVQFDTLHANEGGVAASPTSTVLSALAACTAMDVATVLRKKRQPVAAYQVFVSAEKGDVHPQVFRSIVVEHRLSGEVSAGAAYRAIQLSATTYCPVSAMLSASVPIEHRYRLQPIADGPWSDAVLVVATGPSADQVSAGVEPITKPS